MSLSQAISADVHTAVNVVATWGAWHDGGLAEDVLAVLQDLVESTSPGDETAAHLHAVMANLQAALDAGLLEGGGPGGAGAGLRARVMEWMAAVESAGGSPGPELAAQAEELVPAVMTASAQILDQRISSLADILAAPEPFPDSALCSRIARRLPALRDSAGAGDLSGIVGAARDAGGIHHEIESLRARLLQELDSAQAGFAGEEKAGSSVAALMESARQAKDASLGKLAALVNAFQTAAARQESADEATRKSAARERLTTAMEVLRQRVTSAVPQDLSPALEALLAGADEVLDGSPASAMDAWSDSLAAALTTLEAMDIELQLRESEFVTGQLQRLKGVRQRLAAAAEEGAEENMAALDLAIGKLEKAAEQQGSSESRVRPALEQAAGALAAISTAAGDAQESPGDVLAAIKGLEQVLSGYHGHLSWATFRAVSRLRDELKVQGMDPGALGGQEEKLAEVEETIRRGQEEAEHSRARLQELQSGALQRLRGEFQGVSSRLSASTRQQIEAGFSKIERTLDDEDDISPEVLAGLEEQVEKVRRPMERKAFGLGARTLQRWRKQVRRKAGKAGAEATALFKKGQTAANHLEENLKMGQVAGVEASTGQLRQILWQATGGALRRILLAVGLLVILGGGAMAMQYYLHQPYQVDLGFAAGDLERLTAAGGQLILVSADRGTVREIDGPSFSTTADDYDLFVSFASSKSRNYVRHIRVPSPAYPPIDLETLIP